MPNDFYTGALGQLTTSMDGVPPPESFQQPTNTGGTFNPNDAYDPRIGAGALPAGIYGSQNRAYVRNVQGNELVRDQLTGLLKRGSSAYVDNARLRGEEFAANRGLLNSSIAAGTSERAAIEGALPIATSDAQAYRDAASENQKYLNEKQLADMDAGLRQAAISGQLESARIGERGALQRQRENLAFEGEQKGLDRAFTNLRDYYQYQYELGRLDAQSMHNIDEYARKTGIDVRTQRMSFYNKLMDMVISEPDLYTPEVVGNMMKTFDPVYDEFTQEFDQWWDEIFAEDY